MQGKKITAINYSISYQPNIMDNKEDRLNSLLDLNMFKF